MGTYDTSSGAPISPDVPEPFIFPEEEKVVDLIDKASMANRVDLDIVYPAVDIVRRLCVQRERLRAHLIAALQGGAKQVALVEEVTGPFFDMLGHPRTFEEMCTMYPEWAAEQIMNRQ